MNLWLHLVHSMSWPNPTYFLDKWYLFSWISVRFFFFVFFHDLMHSNSLGYRASDYPRECDGACLQMRLSYSPCAHIFLFLVQWTDCHLAGSLGLIRILIYKVIPVVLWVFVHLLRCLVNLQSNDILSRNVDEEVGDCRLMRMVKQPSLFMKGKLV